MHMADALVSPAVGGVMWAASAGLAVYSAKKIKDGREEHSLPMMGVMGAFVFAAQMINFAIPGTGSSGHLGGGLLLAALLGPWRGFLTMASVLFIQAIFFADGGLLAYGCNVFNLGFFTCFVAYPLVFKPLVGKNPSGGRMMLASLLGVAVGLQLGAFSVVLETLASGVTSLPFGAFVLLMQPIHLAIGIVEGLVTAAVAGYVLKARPELLGFSIAEIKPAPRSRGAVMAAAALVVGCVISWFASSHPDGLEWALERVGYEESETVEQEGVYTALASLQEKTSILPDYGFRGDEGGEAEDAEESWPAVSAGTSVSGLVGGALTLVLAVAIGFVLSRFGSRGLNESDA